MNLRFENIDALWGLLGLALFMAFMLYQGRRFPRSFSWRRFTLASSAFLLCLLGLSRPQLGTRITATHTRRSNLFIAIDVSRSMSAEDSSPSRMGFAVTYTRKLLERLPGVRVALYPFAQTGYLLIPLTSDTAAANDMLNSLSPGMTTDQGTDISAALEGLLRNILHMEVLAKEKGEEWAATQVLLFSDGETHARLDEGILRQYRSRHIPVFAVGTGSVAGTTIPVEGRTPWQPHETLRDRDGHTVISKMHPETLKRIAEVTGGDYFPPHFEEVGRTAGRILQAMELGRLSATFKLEREYYPILFGGAFFLFLLELSFGRWEFALRSVLLPLISLVLVATAAQAQDGNPDPFRAAEAYNEGVAALKQNLSKSAELFQESIQKTDDNELRKKALFNLGNVFLRMGDPAQAIQNYQSALDTHAPDGKIEASANRRISENIVLATKVEQQMKRMQQGDGDPNQPDQGKGQSQDPKGPQKDYRPELFNDQQKNRILDLVSSEEQQILQRLQQEKSRNQPHSITDKTW